MDHNGELSMERGVVDGGTTKNKMKKNLLWTRAQQWNVRRLDNDYNFIYASKSERQNVIFRYKELR